MQIPMKHISLIGFKNDQERVMKSLQNLGAVEVRLTGKNETPADIAGEQERVLAALRYYKTYDKRKTGMFTPLPVVKLSDLTSCQEQAEKAITQSLVWGQRMSSITNEINQIDAFIPQLLPWQDFQEDLDFALATDNVVFMLGYLNRSWEEALKTLDKDQLCVVRHYGDSKGQMAIFLAIHRHNLEQVLTQVSNWGWVDASLPKLKGNAAFNIELQQQKKTQLQAELADLQSTVGEAESDLIALERYYDAISIQNELDQAQQKLGETESTFWLEGWLQAHDEAEVTKAIEASTSVRWLEIRDPLDEEEPPVIMKNNGLVQPFEQITNLFSPPSYRETDPNPVMGFFYWLLFGMMLSDAGYGLVLSIFSFFMYYKTKPANGKRSMYWMLGLCGISTIFWGIMFGSYFGEEPIKHVLVSPMSDPITMLILCYSIGFIHLVAGMLMKAYELVKQGQPLDAFLDVGLWIITLVGIVFYVIPPLAGIAPYTLGFGCLGIIFTHGRSEKNIVAKLGGGLMSLYGITSYLADVLSYSRLFALGLTTGVIAMVFNIIGKMILEISVFGIPIGLVIGAVFLVALHLANLVLNALGAYVHTSRLQFIEFFGKFYNGGGRLFNPLNIKTRYGRLEK